ncbi:polyprenol monophosphomannose synthase [Prosthecochloris sp. N3]|uniref:Polyprenol monophosphomannose synthase n=1 Tax=Prosthecochloris ethylica TaxID=2743976 RepID=A0ABR9XQR0_9CHLB|nr:polyprenol monophosphomannose synthase [Prosthecochloris ethylica]MBF0586422.1 polyprenol monophosphomannose synthase [Prosthecochloris ethylica]MBF0636360.1 polyprenol monophosphomannose synthase [Prosthecochloris ethylica]NUK47534.1 polyprenol monophosphomannose synthase [Prosthecochloris ethylica]
MSAERESVLIIIPTYNEAENIGHLIRDIMEMYHERLDILVIDDSSPDGTAAIVRSLQSRYHGLHILVRAGKLGLGTAYLEGFSFGLGKGYAYLVEMDADYSHDPSVLEEMLQRATGCDLVIGSRYVNNTVNVINWPLSRLILSKVASVYTRLITGMPVSDPTSGYKCFRADVLRQLDFSDVHSQGYSFQIEMNFRVWRKGFSIGEVPIVFVDRTVGRSKMSRENITEAIRIVWWLKVKALFGML